MMASDILALDSRQHVLFIVPRKPYPMRVYRETLQAHTRIVSYRTASRSTARPIVVGSCDWYDFIGVPYDRSAAYLTRSAPQHVTDYKV